MMPTDPTPEPGVISYALPKVLADSERRHRDEDALVARLAQVHAEAEGFASPTEDGPDAMRATLATLRAEGRLCEPGEVETLRAALASAADTCARSPICVHGEFVRVERGARLADAEDAARTALQDEPDETKP